MPKTNLPRTFCTILKGLNLASRLALIILIARLLSSKEAGVYGLYASGLLLSASLIGLNLYSITARELLKNPARTVLLLQRHLGACFLLFPAFAVVACTGYIKFGSGTILLQTIFTLHLLTEFATQESSRLLVALKQPLWAEFINFIRNASWTWVPVVYLTMNLSLSAEGLILAWFLASFVAFCLATFIYSFILFRGMPKIRIHHQWVKRAICAALTIFFANVAFRTIVGLDKYMVANCINISKAGVYTIHASLAFALITMIESAVSVWRYPDLVGALQNRDYSRAQKLLRRFIIENFSISLLFTLVIVNVAPILLHYFGRAEYTADLSSFYLLIGGVFIYCVSLPLHYFQYGMGWDKLTLTINTTGIVVLVVSSPVLLFRYELLGAGLMVLLSLTAIASFRFFAYTRFRLNQRL